MRYEDWDVLLFPRDCGIPFREFGVTCQVVQDTEFAHIHGISGLPTVNCFVPSLAPGAPFQISIHSWNTPTISQFTKSCSKHVNDVKFETRLFIDGRLVASTSLNRQCDWPHVIANGFNLSKNGDLEPLKFPVFQQEILQQRQRNVGDALGRIRLVISEGFPRDSLTVPMERVNNIVAFSFQHAPQELLEGVGIAWPNSSMWQRSPNTTSMSVPSFPFNNVKTHAHSPRLRSNGQQKALAGLAIPMAQSPMFNVATNHVEEPTQASYIGPLPNTDEIPGCSDIVDSFDDTNAYFDWPGKVGPGLNNIPQQFTPAVSKSSHNWELGETGTERRGSVRDSSGSGSDETQFPSLAFSIDDEDPKVLPKTLSTPILAERNQPVPFPIFPHNAVLPEDLALSLTASLLSQPMPLQPHAPPTRTSTPEVRSRKENRKRHSTCPIPSTLSTSTTVGLDHHDQRKVSQQLYIPSNGSIPLPLAQSRTRSPHSPHPDLTKRSHSMSKFVSAQTSSTQSSPRESPNPENKASAEKGNKRSRNFPPGSTKPFEDDEDEHQRASPRIRLSPLAEGHPQDGA
ncbi:hypothetical protein B0J15DRAFT_556761 [Fusarium solani]|uniref:Uncharacterized protein n=1 Tax=Fusarium solani TaxID=169388 RepID=A0A9P9L623_FUSSL|nr:uncharacterized protein B0J15DRAFT_556761 [Fusarium solani]KAH7274888.1 hypothetical protein B0J15DRAFT_556761 [Fusarium solani]